MNILENGLRLKEKAFDGQDFCIFGSETTKTNDNLKTSLEILGATREESILKAIKEEKQKATGLTKRSQKQAVYQGLLIRGFKESDIKLMWDKNTIKEYLTNLITIYTITAFKTGKNKTGRKVVFEKKVLDAEGNTRLTQTISKVDTMEKMNLKGLKVVRDEKDDTKTKDIPKKDMEILNSIIEKIDQDRENGYSIREIKDNADKKIQDALLKAKERFENAQQTSSAWDNFTITLAEQEEKEREEIEEREEIKEA